MTDQRDPLISQETFNEDTMKDYYIERMEQADKRLQETLHKDLDLWELDLNDLRLAKKDGISNASNFSSALTSSALSTLVPRLIEDLMGYAYPIDCVGDNTPEGKLLEMEGRKLLKLDSDDPELLKELWHYVYKATGYGMGAMYTYMEMEKEWVEEKFDYYVINGKAMLNDQGGPLELLPEELAVAIEEGASVEAEEGVMKTEKWKKYGPKSICLDNKHIVYPDDCISTQDAFENDFIGIKLFKTLNEIHKLIKDENALVSKIDRIKAKEFANEQIDPLSKIRINKGKKIEFWLVFGKYDIDNDDLEEYVVMLLHPKSKVLLGYQKFPYDHKRCPIVISSIDPRHNKIAGRGIAEKLFDHKGYLDESRNDRVNWRKIAMFPPMMARKESKFNKLKHKFGMNQIWEGVNFEHIDFMNIPVQNTNQFEDEADVKQEAREIVSLSDVNMGQEPEREQTFRGLMQVLEEGSKSRGMYKKWLALDIKEIFLQRHMLRQQFWGREARQDPQIMEVISKVLDNGKNQLTLDSLSSLDYNLTLKVTATNDEKKLRLLQAKTKWEMFSIDPNIQQSPQHYYNMIIDVLRAMGEEEPETQYPTPEFMEELIQQRQMEVQRKLDEENKAIDEANKFETEMNIEKGRLDVLQSIPEYVQAKEAENEKGVKKNG